MANNPLADIRKDFNLYVDGLGYAGNVTAFTPPTLSVKTDDIQVAGMETPVGNDMGLEKMEAKFTLSKVDYHALANWGLADGYLTPLAFKAALCDYYGNVRPEEMIVRGFVRKVEHAEIKPGERSDTTYTLEVLYYKHTIDGEVVHEIDVLGGIRTVNGKDRRAAIRKAIE